MSGTTKLKTSITLSRETAKLLDRLAGPSGNRSAVVERAIHALSESKRREEQDARERKIIDANAERLNSEAADALGYQIDL